MTDLEAALVQTLADLRQQPHSAPLLARAGAILAALGRSTEALPNLRRSVELEPRQPEALNNLGAVLRTLGRHEEAIGYFERALALSAGYADARYNLAGALVKAGRLQEAEPQFEELLRARPDNAETLDAFAKLRWMLGSAGEAIPIFERALEANPSHAETRANYANALAEVGRIDEAAEHLLRSIELAPDRMELYHLLAESKTSALTPAHVDALEARLSGGFIGDDDRIEVEFALGKIRASQGDRARSFAHLLRANSTRRRYIGYDEKAYIDAFGRIAETFDTAFLASRRDCWSDSTLPIFIFGMPRSGTTLIEQILASHPGVYAGGELDDFEQIVNDVLAAGEQVSLSEMVGASCNQLREIAERYVGVLARFATRGAVRVTDKMPGNVRFAGLIRTILPNARMIHARRNPVDICLSMFGINFGGNQPFAYDLAELGRFYRAYDRLATHWRALLPPEAMIEVQYEDVVDDLERQARRIVAFCGLDWDPACLEFHKAQRPVKTASVAQVRKPLYRTSVNRAAAYGDLLKPLLDALEP